MSYFYLFIKLLREKMSSVYKPLNFTIFFYKTNFVNNAQYLPKV